MNRMDHESRLRGAGGTPGGIGEFVIGLIMVIAGAYLITNQVVVVGGFWSVWGYNAFGLSLVPLVFGIGILFFNGKSDRKSTRLNSSHLVISYAVFCLKKKKKINKQLMQ